MKRVIPWLLGVLSLVLLTACGQTVSDPKVDNWQKYQKEQSITIGFDNTFVPMGFEQKDGSYAGFDIDLAKEVGKRMGVEVQFQPISWNAKEMELETGKVDCLWNGLSINNERLAALYFAKPYLNNRQIVIVPEGSDIKTVADLAGKKIGLQDGSTAMDALESSEVYTSGQIKDEDITKLEENVSVFNELKAGRIDAFIVDEAVGHYIMSHN